MSFSLILRKDLLTCLQLSRAFIFFIFNPLRKPTAPRPFRRYTVITPFSLRLGNQLSSSLSKRTRKTRGLGTL